MNELKNKNRFFYIWPPTSAFALHHRPTVYTMNNFMSSHLVRLVVIAITTVSTVGRGQSLQFIERLNWLPIVQIR